MSAGYVDVFRLEIVILPAPRPFAVVQCIGYDFPVRNPRSEPGLRCLLLQPILARRGLRPGLWLTHRVHHNRTLQPILARRGLRLCKHSNLTECNDNVATHPRPERIET